MGKGLAQKRHDNKRMIKKRYKIMKESWNVGKYVLSREEWLEKSSRKCKKHNLSCSCGMCNKNRDIHGKRIKSLKEINQDKIDKEIEY
jgi:hypothetical protein